MKRWLLVGLVVMMGLGGILAFMGYSGRGLNYGANVGLAGLGTTAAAVGLAFALLPGGFWTWWRERRQRRKFEKAFWVRADHDQEVKEAAVKATLKILIQNAQSVASGGRVEQKRVLTEAEPFSAMADWKNTNQAWPNQIRQALSNWEKLVGRHEKLMGDLRKLVQLARKHGVQFEGLELAHGLDIEEDVLRLLTS